MSLTLHSARTGFASLVASSALVLAACSADAETDAPVTTETGEVAIATIPASLAPFGDGYPNTGDPCRRLGESEATANWLDDSEDLVGCPTADAAAALGGEVLTVRDGITVVSVPRGNANPGLADYDARVAGTDYNATTLLECGFGGKPPTDSCRAGVKRNWGEAGKHLVEVTKPDGRKRAIFFDGTTPFGADSAESDGSAGWDFAVAREGDRTTISYGPETYVVVDALVEGG